MAMLKNEITEKLKEILSMVKGISIEELSELNESSRLIEDVGLNSVGILYIVIGVEEMFGIRFENVGFNDFKTIGDVTSYIERLVN